jgi:hypothetical protein
MEQDGYGLFRGGARKCSSQVVTPELHSKFADCRVGYKIWYSGKLNVERSNREVGISRGGRDEGL